MGFGHTFGKVVWSYFDNHVVFDQFLQYLHHPHKLRVIHQQNTFLSNCKPSQVEDVQFCCVRGVTPVDMDQVEMLLLWRWRSNKETINILVGALLASCTCSCC